MDKWKIAIIAALLLGLAGYGFYQSAATTPPLNADNAVAGNAADGNAPAKMSSFDQDLQKLVGHPAAAWNIPARLWANTPHALTLADVKGHVTVIEFWRAACPHCEAAAPFMIDLFNRYSPRGVKFIGFHSPSLNTDPTFVENDWKQVQGVIKQWGLPYPVAYDTKSNLFRTGYRGQQYPTILVLNAQGVVVYGRTGDTQTKERLLLNFLENALPKGKK